MVHLGVAALRNLALGIKNVQDFDFVDAPSVRAKEMTIRNIQLGAVVVRDDVHELMKEGWDLVKLGIEPHLSKITLKCFHERLGMECLALGAVMGNSSSIFCRVGTVEETLQSDCFKVQFCSKMGISSLCCLFIKSGRLCLGKGKIPSAGKIALM
ncbi:unnamed protein product [Fraxinus pennsylvanica]|uniref:Uncharacterized protein n=1 Tax=Fraxinus pennsylvanica TaxID=56036 RepID=A0AAD1ZXL4_9LAMI|nr:unnamed protein product [Fraxinus pennsylvanica]